MTATEWECEAYGEGAASVGAWCFRSPRPYRRACADADECATFMGRERLRVWARLTDLAAAGDADAAAILAELPGGPGSILGGEQ